MIYFATVL